MFASLSIFFAACILLPPSSSFTKARKQEPVKAVSDLIPMHLQALSVYPFFRLTLVDCSVIGDIEMVHLSLEVQEALRRDCGVEAVKVSRFLRASVKRVELYSFEYKRLKTRNSYTVVYKENEEDKFGLIQYFLSLPTQSVAVVKRLKPTNNYCYSHQLRELQQRIIPVTVETGIHVVPVKSIITKCIYLDLESSKYVARLANDFFEF